MIKGNIHIVTKSSNHFISDDLEFDTIDLANGSAYEYTMISKPFIINGKPLYFCYHAIEYIYFEAKE